MSKKTQEGIHQKCYEKLVYLDGLAKKYKLVHPDTLSEVCRKCLNFIRNHKKEFLDLGMYPTLVDLIITKAELKDIDDEWKRIPDLLYKKIFGKRSSNE